MMKRFEKERERETGRPVPVRAATQIRISKESSRAHSGLEMRSFYTPPLFLSFKNLCGFPKRGED